MKHKIDERILKWIDENVSIIGAEMLFFKLIGRCKDSPNLPVGKAIEALIINEMATQRAEANKTNWLDELVKIRQEMNLPLIG